MNANVTNKEGFQGSRFAAVAGYATLLAYCSLYPFSGWRWPDQPLFSFLLAPLSGQVSRSDLLTNVLAYIPFGFVLQGYISRQKRYLASVFAATITGIFVSFLMESLQMFLPERTASNVDLASNAAGTFFGAAVAFLAGSNFPLMCRFRQLRATWFQPDRTVAPALLAVALWAGSQLSPFVPSIDISSIRAGLSPLWHALSDANAHVSVSRLLATAFEITGLALLMGSFAKLQKKVLFGFFVFSAAVFCSKPLIVSRQLSLESLMGLLAAVLIASVIPPRRRVRALLSAIFITAAFAIREVRPAGDGLHAFNWIPFAGQMDDTLNGFTSILETCWPGVALACSVRVVFQSSRLMEKVLGVLWGLFVFWLERLQQYIPGRFGDFTTVLLAGFGFLAGCLLSGPQMSSSTGQLDRTRAEPGAAASAFDITPLP